MGKSWSVFSSRKEYIHQLSAFAHRRLNLEPDRVEDLIYSKASLFPLRFCSAHLSEKEYYQLAALEKIGQASMLKSRRKDFIPKGNVAPK